MIEVYAWLVINNGMDIEDVPEMHRDEVETAIAQKQLEMANH